jgi:hypothetical protein
MALVKCQECHHQVSDKAVTCPHCGYPLASNITARRTDQIAANNNETNLSAKWAKRSLACFALSIAWLVILWIISNQMNANARAQGKEWFIFPPGYNTAMVGFWGAIFVGVPISTVLAIIGITRIKYDRRLSFVALTPCILVWLWLGVALLLGK